MANVIFPFNRRGIYGIKTVGAPTETDTAVTFQFEAHPYVQMPYNGILIVNVSVAPTTAATAQVYFRTGTDNPVPVTKGDGEPLVGTDLAETGYYLFFFDRTQNVLQIFNSI